MHKQELTPCDGETRDALQATPASARPAGVLILGGVLLLAGALGLLSFGELGAVLAMERILFGNVYMIAPALAYLALLIGGGGLLRHQTWARRGAVVALITAFIVAALLAGVRAALLAIVALRTPGDATGHLGLAAALLIALMYLCALLLGLFIILFPISYLSLPRGREACAPSAPPQA